MARKLRMEYPGAIYHVINRGRDGADVFAKAATRADFIECLFAACQKSGWRLHAFVLMRNHYHLALEVPQGNLATGMQWMQATFSNRLNQVRRGRGHLFQGRYKAMFVEPGVALGQLCHYIHLNPVRAGEVTVGRLKEFHDSSYWYLWRPAERPSCLDVSAALSEAGNLPDSPVGHRHYEKFLVWQAAAGPAGRNPAYASLSRGWYLGSRDFRAQLRQEQARVTKKRPWASDSKEKAEQARWNRILTAGRKALGHTAGEMTRRPATLPWKLALMAFLKESTQVTNGWLVQKFGLARAVYVSKLAANAKPSPEVVRLLAKLRLKCKV